MSKDKNSVVFHEVYPDGKVRMGIGEISESFVTATCSMYEQRSDTDEEFLICEIGIVERTQGQSLAEAFEAAKEMAYENAMAKITPRSGQITATAATQPVKAAPPAPAPEPEPEPESEPDLFDAADLEPPTDTEDGDDPGPDEPDISSATIERVDLFAPEPEFIQPQQPESEPDASEQAIQAARNVTITILGKMNECNGMTAGRILDTAPEVIVEFAPNYTGPKEDQKKALKTLYPEALRRCTKAA